jgi:DNA excision repair protein ERCC-2
VTRLVYCSRTIPEIEKAVGELKRLIKYYKEQTGQNDLKFLGLSLSSRKNLCIHPRLTTMQQNKDVDNQCMNMTTSFVRKNAETDKSIELCSYFENFEKEGQETLLPWGIYNLDDLKEYGRRHNWCPYYLARWTVNHANVILIILKLQFEIIIQLSSSSSF